MQRTLKVPWSSNGVLSASILASFGVIWLMNQADCFRQWTTEVARSTSGWLNPDMVTFLPMTALIVVGIIMLWGRHKASHLGMAWSRLAAGLTVLVGAWAMIQILSFAVALVSGEGLSLHPYWSEPGTGFVLGFLLAMILGTALFEEAMFRGYLLPQIHLRLGSMRSEHGRLITAILVSAVIFSLWHLPTLLLNQHLEIGPLIVRLLSLVGAGIMLALLYLRTANLYVVIAVHALINAPTLIISGPVSGSILAGLIGAFLIIFWPWLAGRPLREPLLRFT